MELLLNGRGPSMEPADWHVRFRMTRPQQALEIRQKRPAEETPKRFSGDSSPSLRKSPDGEPWGNDHPVNIRLSIPLLFARYYVTIVTGKERRSGGRRAGERKKHSLVKVGNLTVMVAFGTIWFLAALYVFQLATAYIMVRSGIMTFGQ